MPAFCIDYLRGFSVGFFEKMGVHPDVADLVSNSVLGNCLYGHDTHGMVLIPRFLKDIETGKIKPDARTEILRRDSRMATKATVVFKLTDVPFIESPDGTMRDSVMVTEDTCGAQQYTAGLFFVRPGTKGHADKHEGQEELYYIFAGRGVVMVNEEPHKIEAGDVVFIPDGSTHYLINDGNETLGLFWAMPTRWSDMVAIQRELGKWREVEPGSDWSPLP